MEVRFPDMFKEQSVETQLLQDLVFIHINNLFEEDLYEKPLWQYINEHFKSYKGDDFKKISSAEKTSMRKYLLQQGVFVSTHPDVPISDAIFSRIQKYNTWLSDVEQPHRNPKYCPKGPFSKNILPMSQQPHSVQAHEILRFSQDA